MEFVLTFMIPKKLLFVGNFCNKNVKNPIVCYLTRWLQKKCPLANSFWKGCVPEILVLIGTLKSMMRLKCVRTIWKVSVHLTKNVWKNMWIPGKNNRKRKYHHLKKFLLWNPKEKVSATHQWLHWRKRSQERDILMNKLWFTKTTNKSLHIIILQIILFQCMKRKKFQRRKLMKMILFLLLIKYNHSIINKIIVLKWRDKGF